MDAQEMAELQKYYRSLRFRRKYTYLGRDLGVRCGLQETRFALWAPTARSVFLLLYAEGADSPALCRIPMEETGCGVWRYTENRNLHGTYYLYEIDHGAGPILAGDPYARSCGLNSRRCMVVDLRKTDPPGWDREKSPEKQPEDLIWETHIKEFSCHPSSGFPSEVRGKYLAFASGDTCLPGNPACPTGIPYLKDLGINTLAIMPFFDYGSVDDLNPEQFNWGYDPLYYNIPEGSYSTDPFHGEVRIRECKQMIAALHSQGFRVIMDVVYNHTYRMDSPFSQVVPGYYYRHDPEGHPSNGSYCGNDIASERPMVSQFILDSVLYWAEEYHIDGFRFDLMGLLNVKLMNRIRLALDGKFGKGEKLVYGEPWGAASTQMEKKALPASKQNASLLNGHIGIFCDNTRDSIKGNVFFSGQPGFVGGAPNLEQSILNSARAWVGRLPGIRSPDQIISYVSCHDNLTLYDKLKVSSPRDRDVLQLNRLAAAIYLTCQGRILMLSGEEFGRTKGGNDNSYNAPLEISALDWSRAYECSGLREYYKGLLNIRKRCPGLCDKTPQAPDRFYSTWAQAGAAGYYLDNRGQSGQGTLCVIYNANTIPISHTLAPGLWNLWADGENSFLWKEKRTLEGTILVPPLSALILSQDEIQEEGEHTPCTISELT